MEKGLFLWGLLVFVLAPCLGVSYQCFGVMATSRGAVSVVGERGQVLSVVDTSRGAVSLVGGQVLSVVDTSRGSDAVILAQGKSPDLVQGLDGVSSAVGELETEIDKLNGDLKKVVGKEIDSPDVDFSSANNKLKKLKGVWEQWKSSWEQGKEGLNLGDPGLKDVQDLLGKVDNDLGELEKVLSPLNKDIIQSKEQFKKKEKIPALKKYQESIFGDEATSDDVDGIFGRGTQRKIEAVLSQDLVGIKYALALVKVSFLSVEGKEVKESGDGNKGVQKQVEELEKKVEEQNKTIAEQKEIISNANQQIELKDKEIERLGGQVNEKPTPKPTVESSPEMVRNESGKKGNFLVVWVFVVIMGGVVFLVYRIFVFSQKTKRTLASNKRNVGRQGERGNEQGYGNGMLQGRYGGSDDDDMEEEESYQPPLVQGQGGYGGSDDDDMEEEESYRPPLVQGGQGQGRNGTLMGKMSQVAKTVMGGGHHQGRGGQQNRGSGFDVESITNYHELVSVYNNDDKARRFFNEMRKQKLMTTVMVDKRSIEDKRAGYDVSIRFDEAESGNYLIVDIPRLREHFYYLLPKKNLTVNEYSYGTVQAVFECEGYEGKTGNNFVLREPAVVQWDDKGIRLAQPGILRFN